jgi:hypothetical protein
VALGNSLFYKLNGCVEEQVSYISTTLVPCCGWDSLCILYAMSVWYFLCVFLDIMSEKDGKRECKCQSLTERKYAADVYAS